MNCVFLPLEKAMAVRNLQRNRLPLTPSVEEVCKNITDHVIDPTLFNNTKSNPNSQTIKSLFNEIGKDDIFWHIKDDFDKEWPVATHSRFAPEKLDELLNRRNVVAHTDNALNITRVELGISLEFIKILAKILDSHLENHVEDIKKNRFLDNI